MTCPSSLTPGPVSHRCCVRMTANNFLSMANGGDCVGEKLAPFNPSGDEVIRTAIDMLQVGHADVVYDLGCGDGRMLIEAIKTSGARGVGVEYDKRFADRAHQRVAEAGLGSKITIIHANVLDIDPTGATAVFVYLIPAGMLAVREALVALLKAGARVVTYVFSMPDLVPVRVETFKATKIYLYTATSLGNASSLEDVSEASSFKNVSEASSMEWASSTSDQAQDNPA